MAIIPGTAKVLNQYENVNTTYGGSKAMKAQSKWYTMDDVIETINAQGGSGVTEIIAGDGISVDEGTGVVTITNTVEPYVAPYTVFTALVKQEGTGGSVSSLSSGSVQVGVTYRLSGVSNASDFSNVGGPGAGEAVDDTYFVAINNETPLNYGGGLLLYDQGAPTATILENTIGNIWFEYNGEGRYYIKSDSLFTLDKTFINGTPLTGYSVLNNFVEPSGGADADRGYFLSQSDALIIELSTMRGFTNFRDDVLLYPTCIEIRVYN
jgi:hypothetical protein